MTVVDRQCRCIIRYIDYDERNRCTYQFTQEDMRCDDCRVGCHQAEWDGEYWVKDVRLLPPKDKPILSIFRSNKNDSSHTQGLWHA